MIYDNYTGSFQHDQSIQLPEDSEVLITLSEKEKIIKYVKLNQTALDDRTEEEDLFIS